MQSQVTAGQSIPFFKPTGDWGRTTQLGPLQLGIPPGERFAITSEASCSLKVSTLRCSRTCVPQEASVRGQTGRSPGSNACQVVSAFPLHKFRVFVLMQLIISPFPLLPDVSCLARSLSPTLPFVSGLSPGSGQRQTSASPLPTVVATRSPEHRALCPFTGLQHSAPGDT